MVFTLEFFKSWLVILVLNIISIVTIVITSLYERRYEKHSEEVLPDHDSNKWISPFALGIIVFLVCLVCVGLLFFDVDGYIANLVSGNWSFGIDFVLPLFLLVLLVVVQSVTLVPFFLIRHRRKIMADAEAERKALRNYSIIVILADFVIVSFLIMTIGDYLASV